MSINASIDDNSIDISLGSVTAGTTNSRSIAITTRKNSSSSSNTASMASHVEILNKDFNSQVIVTANQNNITVTGYGLLEGKTEKITTNTYNAGWNAALDALIARLDTVTLVISTADTIDCDGNNIKELTQSKSAQVVDRDKINNQRKT